MNADYTQGYEDACKDILKHINESWRIKMYGTTYIEKPSIVFHIKLLRRKLRFRT